ncbi:MAG: deoxyribodipyrimidine photolyase, partial [candidate division Zixibacteria bacterium]|nr:deoxyribodipyrimidine photolyase [candidate division Zixibacteria bacterium]
LNEDPVNADGAYVVYWMIAARRTHFNFGLQRALEHAKDLNRPLLVLEALRCGYRWASDRHHQFLIDGMADNARRLDRKGVHYYPYVEPTPDAGKGLLAALAEQACVIVTDQYPAFFLPRMLQSAAGQVSVRFEAIDSNGLLPLPATEKDYPTAYAFRRHVQKILPDHLSDTPRDDPLKGLRLPEFDMSLKPIEKRWPVWECDDDRSASSLQSMPIDHHVGIAPVTGGEKAARDRLSRFIENGLSQYGDLRNSVEHDVTSRLSPYLHFGHISPHEVFAAVMDHQNWSTSHVFPKASGSRSGWWGVSEAAEGFLDQLITWRELGFNMCVHRRDYDRYESLPDWAQATLREHRKDKRSYLYSLEEFETAATHDELWNAAQRQLVREGQMHNYLRMVWGKKILEWTRSPEDALDVMVELNNKYALDGRDPNSYSGIFWCLGRYDRPWGPERPIFGKIRYMSSANTARKMNVTEYLERYSE